MSDEIKVFKCDKCGSGCIVSELDDSDPPNTCIYGDAEMTADWQPATDYQIIKKGKIVIDPKNMELDKMYLCERLDTTDGPLFVSADIEDEIRMGTTFKDFVITKKDKYPVSDLNQYPVKKYKTPNCAICEWKHSVMIMIKTLVSSGAVHECEAQAYKPLEDVYNSPECQKLFKPKHEPTVGPPMEELEKLNKSD